MKASIFLTALAAIFTLAAFKGPDKAIQNAVRAAVTNYTQAADAQDAAKLEQLFSEHFRAVVNNKEGKPLMVVDRQTYLDFIKARKFGGDQRKVSIESVNVQEGINATVKVTLTGEKAVFQNLVSLALIDNKWQIVQDLAYMQVQGS